MYGHSLSVSPSMRPVAGADADSASCLAARVQLFDQQKLEHSRPKMLTVSECSDFTLRGIKILDAPCAVFRALCHHRLLPNNNNDDRNDHNDNVCLPLIPSCVHWSREFNVALNGVTRAEISEINITSTWYVDPKSKELKEPHNTDGIGEPPPGPIC